MTPEQLERVRGLADSPSWFREGERLALAALLAAFDAQEAELAGLRQLALLLAQDENAGAVEAGAMREREAALAELEGDIAAWQAAWPSTRAKAILWALTRYAVWVRNRGPLLAPLPPEQLAAENARLRAALADMLGVLFPGQSRFQNQREMGEAVEKARKLLAGGGGNG